MKRKTLLLSALGFATGLLVVLENNRRKQSASRKAATNRGSSANGESASASRANASDTARRGAAMRPESRKHTAMEAEPHQLDDHGTDQAQASHILQEIRDTAFEASNEKLAIALGRPTEEIEQWTNGDGLIDGDVLLKARALAIHRGVEVE